MLFVEESCRKTNGGGSSNNTALVLHSISKERDCAGNNQDQFEYIGKNKGKCWNCGKKGPMRRDCRLNPKTNPQATTTKMGFCSTKG